MENQASAQFIAKLEALSWYSGTKYMETDIHFIIKLLSAPVYKNTPNLYERLVTYKHTMETLSRRLSSFQDEVVKFKENILKYPEDNSPSIDEYYYGRMKYFMDNYMALDSDFLSAKYEVFSYLESTLLTSNESTKSN